MTVLVQVQVRVQSDSDDKTDEETNALMVVQ